MNKTGLFTFLGLLAFASGGVAAPATFTMRQVLDYPFISEIAANAQGGHIAFVRNLRGVRNVWVADAPGYAPRQVTHYAADDGQEITQLTFSPDGRILLYVRGGDHDANWPAAGDLAPDPDSALEQPKVTIWRTALDGGAPLQDRRRRCAQTLVTRPAGLYRGACGVERRRQGQARQAVLRSRQG